MWRRGKENSAHPTHTLFLKVGCVSEYPNHHTGPTPPITWALSQYSSLKEQVHPSPSLLCAFTISLLRSHRMKFPKRIVKPKVKETERQRKMPWPVWGWEEFSLPVSEKHLVKQNKTKNQTAKTKTLPFQQTMTRPCQIGQVAVLRKQNLSFKVSQHP